MAVGSAKKRVCFIGLDGVGLHNLKRILDARPLRGLSEIFNKGFVSSFTSVPPYTPLAWTSILAGVNPGIHGIFGFHRVFRETDGFKVKLATSEDVEYPRIFEIASMNKLKSIVINVPFTYPPHMLVGFEKMIIVSDWSSPKQFIYPKSIENIYKEYLVEPPHEWQHTELNSYISKVEEYIENRINIYYDLIEKYEYNLYIIIFSELDWLMHRIPDIIEGNNLNLISKILLYIDNFIKYAMNMCDLLVIASDHGFQIVRYFIGINSILAKNGILNYNFIYTFKNNKKLHKRANNKSKLISNIIKIIRKIVPEKLYKLIERKAPLRTSIDFHTSKAFMLEDGSWGIYAKKQYINDVVQIFYNNEFINRIMKANELFYGPYLNRAPDVILVPREGVWFDTRVYVEEVENRVAGEHDPTALLMIYGDNILRYNELKNNHINDIKINIYDIAYIILYYLDVPLPEYSRKDILKKIFYNIDNHNIKTYDYLTRFKLSRKIRQRGPFL